MDLPEKPNRREFTSATIMALLSGVTVTIVGCSSDSNGNPNGPSNPDGDVSGQISANHGHTVAITEAQLTAANAVTLTMGGNADHPHTVSLTMQEVTQVAAGQRVDKESTNNPSATSGSHSHTVIFN